MFREKNEFEGRAKIVQETSTTKISRMGVLPISTFSFITHCSWATLFSSVNAVAAAVMGEIEEDQKHEAHVERAGGRFYPSVMETLGVWTPPSLLLLHNIAARTTLCNDLRVRQATRNLLQQLSVKCWSHNANMLLTLHSIAWQ